MRKTAPNHKKADEISQESNAKRLFQKGGPGGPGRPKNSSKWKTEDYIRFVFDDKLPEEMVKKVAMLIRQDKPHIVLKGIEFITKMAEKKPAPKELISPHVMKILNAYQAKSSEDLLEDNHLTKEKVRRGNDGH